MTDAHRRSVIAGDASFVIACPACHGQLAALVMLLGLPAGRPRAGDSRKSDALSLRQTVACPPGR